MVGKIDPGGSRGAWVLWRYDGGYSGGVIMWVGRQDVDPGAADTSQGVVAAGGLVVYMSHGASLVTAFSARRLPGLGGGRQVGMQAGSAKAPDHAPVA